MDTSSISEKCKSLGEACRAEAAKRIIGQTELLDGLLTAIIADGLVSISPNTGIAVVLILAMTGIISIFVENVATVLVMAPIAIASMMEHIGDMSAISATVGQNFIEEPGLHRTLLGDGLATALSGLIGGPANTTYGENTGVLELSKVYDPVVIRIAAVFAIVLSFIPKFSGIISTMPAAIIGGGSFMLYGMISAIGVRNVVENKVDLTKSRNLIIAGVIFVFRWYINRYVRFNNINQIYSIHGSI